MTNHRKASIINLVVGVTLILLGAVGMASLTTNLSNTNLFGGMSFVLVFVLLGGYETGKYAEMRHEQKKALGNLTAQEYP
jgi:hypothetical protein